MCMAEGRGSGTYSMNTQCKGIHKNNTFATYIHNLVLAWLPARYPRHQIHLVYPRILIGNRNTTLLTARM